MQTKANRTIEAYKIAGADFRLYKDLGDRLLEDAGKLLTKKEQESLVKAMKQIRQICCACEDRMLSDHPDLPEDYATVFFGSLKQDARNEVDSRVIELAKKQAETLFVNSSDPAGKDN